MCGSSFFHDQCGAILIGRSFYFCHVVYTSKLTGESLGSKSDKNNIKLKLFRTDLVEDDLLLY